MQNVTIDKNCTNKWLEEYFWAFFIYLGTSYQVGSDETFTTFQAPTFQDAPFLLVLLSSRS